MSGDQRLRADQLLVRLGLATSREQAQALIRAGRVRVGHRSVERPSQRLPGDAPVEVVAPLHPYASRGGLKLERVLRSWPIPVQGAVAMDVGASTGGFTDCLLQHGARKVYAIDVGYGQLAWKLRTDPRVVVLERTNVRYLTPSRLDEPVDLIVVDVSFISVTLFLERLVAFLRPAGWMVVLVKPQFEAGRDQVSRGGVVKDTDVHRQVLRKVAACGLAAGLGIETMMASPLLGPRGNAEFFIVFKRPGLAADEARMESLVAEALRQVPHPG
ncbi:TlyA family RNA methyltransferase [Geochorda subterranea]|uniref:TlyA family RNA methyltransferase n=1 Tax=Geochorda subterranea TaxID=3109564 RepID=A0ABZ1BKU3_9FIRM|nr:TlyA family RNA methyltransferase [Limnochorda sp. LNt]WRP13451.1 TlyA family RNA methyltransferase [Limnochorda sp. LNt]